MDGVAEAGFFLLQWLIVSTITIPHLSYHRPYGSMHARGVI